jgi:hypothetical protein
MLSEEICDRQPQILVPYLTIHRLCDRHELSSTDPCYGLRFTIACQHFLDCGSLLPLSISAACCGENFSSEGQSKTHQNSLAIHGRDRHGAV